MIVINDRLGNILPDVFSPYATNEENRKWGVYRDNPSIESIESVSIFDRWGSEMLHRENISMPESHELWDSGTNTFRQEVAGGVYGFVMFINTVDGEQVRRQGTITVIK